MKRLAHGIPGINADDSFPTKFSTDRHGGPRRPSIQPRLKSTRNLPCSSNGFQNRAFVIHRLQISRGPPHRQREFRVIPSGETLNAAAAVPVGCPALIGGQNPGPGVVHRARRGSFPAYPLNCPEEFRAPRPPPGLAPRRAAGARLPPDARNGPTQLMAPPLILASRSEARATLLRQARVAFETVPAAVDEAAVKAAMLAEAAPARDIADALAELKARRVAARSPGPPGARRRPGAGLRRPPVRQAARPRRGRAPSSRRCAAARTSCCLPLWSSRTAGRSGATSGGRG